MDATERRQLATDEASYWWQQLCAGDWAEASEEDRRKFVEWLRESPLHVAELLHISHVNDSLRRFRAWHEVLPGEPEAPATVVQMPAAGMRTGSTARRRPGFVPVAVAALALLAVAAGWVLLFAGTRTIATERAERREFMLVDGSVVKLEPESVLHVDLRGDQRRVELRRGRALFEVARDPQRPFLVGVDNTLVRAVGTAFGVERTERNIVVTVAEGKVAVFAADAPAVGRIPQPGTPGQEPDVRRATGPVSHFDGEVLLTAGKQLTVARSGSREVVRDVDTSRALAWSEGRLVFDSVPLAAVAEEFNRYNHVQLQIDDPQLARRPISGVFQASDLESLVAFIRAGAGVRFDYREGDRVLVVSASAH